MASKPYDFAAMKADLAEMLLHRPKFVLDPVQMDQLAVPVPLAWQQCPFDPAFATSVSAKPGIYAFAVQHSRAGLPPHGYVLYIGQTGAAGGKTRTLRGRFGEYFKERARPKRTHVHFFLNNWKTCLVFHFAEVNPSQANLLAIEAALNDAMVPPFSVGDFTATVRKKKRLSDKF